MDVDKMMSQSEDYIVYAESKLNSAQILINNKQLKPAIALAILAHKEVGKVDYLMDAIMIKEIVSDAEWSSFIKDENILKKLIPHLENIKKIFKEITDLEFTYIQNSYKQIFDKTIFRKLILQRFQTKIDILEDLNNFKNKVLSGDKSTESRELTQYELKAIFSWIDFETRLSIGIIKFKQRAYSFAHTGNDLEYFEALYKEDSSKNVDILKKEAVIPDNVKKHNLARSILRNL